MSLKLSVLIVALETGSAFAAPATNNHEHHFEDIQCRCLNFRATEQPTLCNFHDSEDFGWKSAQTLASQYHIPVQFASKSTISKLLSLSVPLPSDVLQVTGDGDAESSSLETSISQNKIICGFGNEAKQFSHHTHDYGSGDRFVAQVVVWLMLLVVLYIAGEYVWTIFSTRNRVFKLKGEEKPLNAKTSGMTSSKTVPSSFT